MTSPNIVEFQGHHWLFYMGINERHDCESPDKVKAIGAATIPLGRLVYLTTRSLEQEGYVETVLLRLPARFTNLVVDVNTGARGTVQPELRHPNGTPVQGFSRETAVLIRGADGANIECGWTGGKELTSLATHHVRLRFYLFGGAKIFSFRAA